MKSACNNFELLLFSYKLGGINFIPLQHNKIKLRKNIIMFVELIITVFILFYIYGTKNYNYWKDRNVVYKPPLPLVGNNLRTYFRKTNFVILAKEYYHEFPNEKFVGFYRGSQPELIIRDPKLARQILVNDFMHFYKRGLGFTHNSVFNSDGDKWKFHRTQLSAAFTSKRFKLMVPLIVECIKRLNDFVSDLIDNGKEKHDLRELMTKYGLAVIATTALGIEANTFKEEDEGFRNFARIILGSRIITIIQIALKEILPGTIKTVPILTPEVRAEMQSIHDAVVGKRKGVPSNRHDIIDFMLETLKQKSVHFESMMEMDENGKPVTKTIQFTRELMVLQTIENFSAGFDTTATTTTVCLYHLARNPDIQNKAREEIRQVLSKYNNELSYENIKEMTYTENCYKEGLRMHPSAGTIHRECTKKYRIPETNIVIDEGTKVIIPFACMQMDPKYFKNPDTFDPERFSNEDIFINSNPAFIPFGNGPRHCIGARLGLIQSKLAIIALLCNFELVTTENTSNPPLAIDEKSIGFLQSIKYPLEIRFKRLKNVIKF